MEDEKKNKPTFDLSNIATEAPNPHSVGLDQMSIPQILAIINQEDHLVADAVAHELGTIAKVVEAIVTSIRNGGRLFLCGAGTSGRLAIMEASECPPTFSTPPSLVQGIMAGGKQAVFEAVEGAEDDALTGSKTAEEHHITGKDFALGISASGRTPFVLGFLNYARHKGAKTALLCCSHPPLASADFVMMTPTGAEILSGSTRMKAATAAKMVLNMITTTAMVSLGKVYDHWMVDVNPKSSKLIDRAARIVAQITGCPKEKAIELVQSCGNAKVAAVMYMKNVDAETARYLLDQHQGRLRDVIKKS